jgi:hypothetical protein
VLWAEGVKSLLLAMEAPKPEGESVVAAPAAVC